MASTIPSVNADNVTINEALFRPGVLDYIKKIAEKDGAKILLLFKETGEKVMAAFVEVEKIIKQIIFIPTENKDKIQDNITATFFISADGIINFA